MELIDHPIRQSLQSGLTALTWGSTAILITLSGSFATGVQAQPEQQRLAAIEEIVVTARRRDESLQEVPIAITAFDDQYLREANIHSFTDLRGQVPSLGISVGGSSTNTPQVSLRGLRPDEVLITLDPAVPMYFAEVVMTPTQGTNLAMYDLANVQVLKGPQGTLFGRNSTGGAVLVTPKSPGEQFGGYINLKAGNYGMVGFEGAVDLPVSDAVQFRVAAHATQRDGYQENVADNALNGDDFWDEDSMGGRISMKVQFGDSVENLLVTSYDENDIKARVPEPLAFNPGSDVGALYDPIHNGGLAGLAPIAANFGLVIPTEPAIDQALARQATRDWQDIETDLNATEKIENILVSNTTTWDLGNGMIVKNILGYRNLDFSAVNDTDGTALPLFGSPTDGFVNLDPDPRTVDTEQFSNELQLLGTSFDDRLEWLVGAYWYQLEGEETAPAQVVGANPNWPQGDSSAFFATLQALETAGQLPPGTAAGLQFGVWPIALNGLLQNSPNGTVENDSVALFAEATYALTDRWDLTLGLRQTWDDRQVTVSNLRFNTMTGAAECQVRDRAGNLLPLDNCARTESEKFSSPSWRFTANYDVMEGMMVYGSVSTGYRSGGFNMRGTNNTTLEPFDEETVTTFELGHKTDWALGSISSVRTNLAVYFSEYDDIQKTQDVPAAQGTGFETNTVNAAKAEIKGVELDATFAPTDNLEVSIAYSYVDAEYKEWQRPDAGGFIDASGQPFIWIPEHSANASVRYRLPLDASIGEVSFRASVYWQDDMFTDDTVSRDLATKYPTPEVAASFLETEIEESYSVINLRADWRAMLGSNLDLALFVDNASDEEYRTGGLTVEDSLGWTSGVYGAPRTYGASLNWNF